MSTKDDLNNILKDKIKSAVNHGQQQPKAQ